MNHRALTNVLSSSSGCPGVLFITCAFLAPLLQCLCFYCHHLFNCCYLCCRWHMFYLPSVMQQSQLRIMVQQSSEVFSETSASAAGLPITWKMVITWLHVLCLCLIESVICACLVGPSPVVSHMALFPFYNFIQTNLLCFSFVCLCMVNLKMVQFPLNRICTELARFWRLSLIHI